VAKILEALRVNVMGDLTLPALAQVIQSKGRGPDTILAHITPKEAEKLKRDGGAGTINPDTGLPEFYEDYYTPTDTGGYPSFMSSSLPEYTPTASYAPDFSFTGGGYEPDYYTGGGYDYSPSAVSAAPEFYEAPGAYTGGIRFGETQRELQPIESLMDLRTPTGERPGVGIPQLPREAIEIPRGGAPTERGFTEKLKEYLTNPEVLGKLGIAGLGAITGAKTAKQAREQGQAGKKETQDIAAPYAVRGRDLVGRAERGELTPSNLQTYQATQARLAQGVESRGGVGAAQVATQLASLRNELLQNQYDYGLKILGIADNIALGAIKTGLEADRYVNELTGNYFKNIAATVYGSAVQPPRA
jgi:hypothetical protein